MSLAHMIEDVLVQAGHARLLQERAKEQDDERYQQQSEVERIVAATNSNHGGGGVKSKKNKDATVPYLLALRQLMPQGSDLVLRALQLLQDGRLTIVVGTKQDHTRKPSVGAPVY